MQTDAMRVLCTLALFLIAVTRASAQSQEVPLPEIPLRVIDEAKERAAQSLADRQGSTESRAPPSIPSEPRPEQYPVEVTVQPGVNTIVTISKGLMNRIVTPWVAPKVHTVNPAVVEVRGRVIYVATDHDEPIGLFITTDESEAYSLTLVPRSIPPRELRLGSANRAAQGDRDEAARWETAQPYVETIKLALQALALGRLPSGYGEREPSAEEHALYTCAFDDGSVNYLLVQVAEGQHLAIGSLIVENGSSSSIELRESLCYRAGVRAVSAWPNVLLEPGESTHLYIVRGTELDAGGLAAAADLSGDSR